ncbi:hypothetical protein D3Z45_16610 [Lachnospiraceae bacterium]|nr:hypothetical protein [Lachnospiraceae bacterium]
MIKDFTKILTTEVSHPFCSAVKRCNMEQYGYVEEEYLFEGTANIYRTGMGGRPEVEYKGQPYTNRFIVRYPADAETFSGNIAVEITNSTANFDIERVWAESYRYLMRHGHIYVGVTSKPNVFPALKKFDSGRYGALNWPNPAYGIKPAPEAVEKVALLGAEEQEMGYIWDILLEMPAFLKSKTAQNPLAAFHVERVYLTGWSQSCSYINRLLNSFIYPDKKPAKPVYDGYLAAGGVHSLGTPLNRYECNAPMDSMEKRIDYCPVPLVELNTESENSDEGGYGGYSARRADSDGPGFCYRYMEITGSCHDAVHSCRDYSRFDGDVEKALGFKLTGFDWISAPNDYPKHFAFHVAMHDLFLWAEKGAAPVHIPRIRQTADGRNLKDAFGNSIGGLRTPLLELPVARYISGVEMPGADGGSTMNYLMGYDEYFSAAFLNELYTDDEMYRERVRETVLWEVKHGMVLAEDAEELENYTVETAINHGLHKRSE